MNTYWRTTKIRDSDGTLWDLPTETYSTASEAHRAAKAYMQSIVDEWLSDVTLTAEQVARDKRKPTITSIEVTNGERVAKKYVRVKYRANLKDWAIIPAKEPYR